jgi:hypothetical protein
LQRTIYLVGFFLSPDDQKCSLRVLLGFVVWGSEQLFLWVLKKVIFVGHKLKFFFLKKDSNYFNMIHRKKSLKKLFFMGGGGGEIKG